MTKKRFASVWDAIEDSAVVRVAGDSDFVSALKLRSKGMAHFPGGFAVPRQPK